MRNLDAEVIRVKGNYDNSLKECIEQSKKIIGKLCKMFLGKDIKKCQNIMAGYTIMIKEIIDQIR